MRHRTLTLIIAGIIVGACGETPTNPIASDPQFAKGGPKEIQVNLTEWMGLVSSPSGDLPGEITRDGRLFVNTEGTNKIPDREICVDLSDSIAVLDQETYDLFTGLVAADDPPGDMHNVCSVVTMHTRDHSNDAKMGGQGVGDIEHSGGKNVLKDFATGRDTWEWRLIWDAVPDYADPEATDLGQGVCIDHPDNDTWYVYNDDDVMGDLYDSCDAQGIEIDNIIELWRVYGEKPNTAHWYHVADFVMPFRFTVSRQ